MIRKVLKVCREDGGGSSVEIEDQGDGTIMLTQSGNDMIYLPGALFEDFVDAIQEVIQSALQATTKESTHEE